MSFAPLPEVELPGVATVRPRPLSSLRATPTGWLRTRLGSPLAAPLEPVAAAAAAMSERSPALSETVTPAAEQSVL